MFQDNIIDQVAKIACDNQAPELFDLLTVTLFNEYSEENVHDLTVKDLLSWCNWSEVLKVWGMLLVLCN